MDSKITLREMTLADIPLGMRLKTLAQWNQLEPDWEILIKAGKQANIVACYQAEEAGTATTLSYQNRFSWIGMVLVDPAFRGMGIGTALLQEIIRRAGSLGTVRLDATPQGQKLYQTLGFETERTLWRMERKAAPLAHLPHQPCSPVTKPVLEKIMPLDTTVFGADRSLLLHHLFRQSPAYAWYSGEPDNLSGYCLGRSGSHFEQIGPLLAHKQQEAQHVFLTALQACAHRDVITDVFAENVPWLSFLQSLGFTMQRPFIRMHLGPLTHPGQPDNQFAIAGPELG
jgi:GNAT superfamily N-acetyltransferase